MGQVTAALFCVLTEVNEGTRCSACHLHHKSCGQRHARRYVSTRHFCGNSYRELDTVAPSPFIDVLDRLDIIMGFVF